MVFVKTELEIKMLPYFIPLLMKCHTPRAITTTMATILKKERPVIRRAVNFTLYTFINVIRAVDEIRTIRKYCIIHDQRSQLSVTK